MATLAYIVDDPQSFLSIKKLYHATYGGLIHTPLIGLKWPFKLFAVILFGVCWFIARLAYGYFEGIVGNELQGAPNDVALDPVKFSELNWPLFTFDYAAYPEGNEFKFV